MSTSILERTQAVSPYAVTIAMPGPGTNCSAPYPLWPPIASYPVDGFGGTFYDVSFSVPVYNPDSDYVYDTVSWHEIDRFHRAITIDAVGSAVIFGICAITLINVIVLTPQPKRQLILHKFICFALISQLIRHTALLIISTRSLQGSSYLQLTNDWPSTTISKTCYFLVAVAQASACTSFIFVQACFYIQGRALMTWLSIHHRPIYFTVLTYLIVTGMLATTFRIGSAVYQSIHPTEFKMSRTAGIFLQGTLILYAISIGSWSSVFLASVLSIIVSRRRILMNGPTVYDIALNLIAIIGLESFILPIFFCIMQFTDVNGLVNPEHFIVPSVLFLLPLGALFPTCYGSHNVGPAMATATTPKPLANVITKRPSQGPHRGTVPDSSRLDFEGVKGQDLTVTAMTPESLSATAVGNRLRKVTDPFEVELALIDGLDAQENSTYVDVSTERSFRGR